MKSHSALMGGGLRYRLLATTSLVSTLAAIALASPPAIAPANAASCADNVTGNSPAVSNAGAINCISVNGGSVAGNVTNTQTGTITAGNQAGTQTGILITNGTVGGSVVNNGTITAPHNGGAINVTGNSNVAGGITNTGSVSGNLFAIQIRNVPTFAGGITNSGTISGKSPTTAAVDVVALTVFSGGITNSGTISAVADAIHADLVSTFAGGISNGGLIHAGSGGIVAADMTTFSGGISNAGTIVAFTAGIRVGNDVSTFTGGVSNSGTITVAFDGIFVINVPTFQGGISNGGTIRSSSRTGILVQGAGNAFTGGITNAGTITSQTNGIAAVSILSFSGGLTNAGSIAASIHGGAMTGAGVGLYRVSTFAGGLTNIGSISVNVANGEVGAGIFVAGPELFSNGITNAGSISVSGGGTDNGIRLVFFTNFSGGISNKGVISVNAGQATGIGLATGSVFSGGITNSGSISVAGGFIGAGIFVFNVSTFLGGISNAGIIAASNSTGISVLGGGVAPLSTFAGGITNSGTISAVNNGIEIGKILNFSGGLTNAGSIALSVNGSNGMGTGAGLTLFKISTFAGGLTNSGSISVKVANGFTGEGILLGTLGVVSNGLTNTGTISVSGAGSGLGVVVQPFTSFSGGISNQGVIALSVAGQGSGIVVGAGSVFAGGITNSGSISTAGNYGIIVVNVSTFSGVIANTGNITAGVGIGVVDNSAVGIFDSGSIVGTGGTAIDLSHNAPGNTLTLGPGFSITGNVLGQGADTLQLGGAGTGAFNLSTIGTQYTGFTTFNVSSATWVATGTGNESWAIANGATLQLGNGGSGANAGAINGNVVDNGTFAIDRSDAYSYAGTISGSGMVVQMGPGTTVLTGNNSYSGGTVINGGTLTFSGAGTLGAATGTTTINAGGTLNLGGTTQTQATVNLAGGTVANGSLNAALKSTGGTINGIGGTASVTATAGTTLVEGTNGYTGTTNINGGTLNVIGAITSSSAVNVNAGGTLTGTGTVDPNIITIASGGTFTPGTAGVPGTSMTIAGNLAFQSGALYAVYMNATTSSFANVTGTAALAGTVNANLATTSPSSKQQYTILQSAGLNGTTFSGVTTNLKPGFGATLTYSADDVFLNVIAALGAGVSLNQNQQNVANAVNAVFNSGSTLPTSFLTLFNLTGAPLANALTQLDGEDATGAEHGAIELTNEFLSLMLDPFVYGRGGPASGGGALGFAPDQDATLPPDVALGYAGVLKAPPKPQNFDQRWTVWGASYGGSATFDGNAAVGSTNVTTSAYGFAAGADYHAAPDMVLGFALAGAGTNWDLAQGLGTGRSDAFQAGVYGTKYFGPAYLGAALAFTNNWFTTNRIALGDQLTANFQGQSYGVRVEGGYRFTPSIPSPASGGGLGWGLGVTPYAAIQAQSFHTPAYSETDLTGGGFGLSYNPQNATDTRGELGARFDNLTTWGAIPVQLRARIAWAHDWVSDPALSAVFEALPGSSFIVNGAPVPHDSALTTVGAELHLTPQWTLIGKFDGEFASSAQTYAGSGTLRYSW